MPADGLEADTTTISASPVLVSSPKAPVISVSVAFTHESATVTVQVAFVAAGSSEAVEDPAHPDRAPTARTPAARAE